MGAPGGSRFVRVQRGLWADAFLGVVGVVAILLGIFAVKDPILAVGGFTLVALLMVSAFDVSVPVLAWVAVAPFVQALPLESPLVLLTFAFHRLLLPVAAIGAILGASVRRQLRLFTAEKILLVFLAYALGSLVLNWRGIGGVAAGEAQRTLLLAYVVPFGALVLGYRVAPAAQRRVLLALAAMAGVISAGGIVQSLAGVEIFPGAAAWQEIWEPRAVGSLGNPAVTGYVTHVGVFVAVFVAARYRAWRVPAIAVAAVGAAFTVLTYTRSVWVGLLLGAVTVAWLYPRARAWVVGGIVVAVLAFVFNVGGFVDSAFLEERAGNQENVQGRVAFGSTGFKMFADRPLLGHGFGTYDVKSGDYAVGYGTVGAAVSSADTSHNSFLTLLAELGIVGFFLYGAALVAALRRSIAALRGRVPSADRLKIVALLAGVVSYLVSANLIDMRFFSFAISLFWFNVGLLDASVRDGEARPA